MIGDDLKWPRPKPPVALHQYEVGRGAMTIRVVPRPLIEASEKLQ